MGDFSHLSATGEAAMVSIAGKEASARTAVVVGTVRVSAACAEALAPDAAREIARTARLAGILAAKQTHLLIPLCHQVPLAYVDIKIAFAAPSRTFDLEVTTHSDAATGVEMEGFCAAAVAGATIYDMIKAIDPAAVVGPFRLVEKRGGKRGLWRADAHE
jgi:cyclic pyranopterin phosphate synthase